MLEKFRGMAGEALHDLFSHRRDPTPCSARCRPPVGVNPRNFYFAIALLDQSYWIAGSVIGAVAGAVLPIDTTGIDFAMTALFVVIAVEQWETYASHIPALLGSPPRWSVFSWWGRTTCSCPPWA